MTKNFIFADNLSGMRKKCDTENNNIDAKFPIPELNYLELRI